MSDSAQKLAVVTGASTGIGLELAKIAASKGYDLVIAADEQRNRQRRQADRRQGRDRPGRPRHHRGGRQAARSKVGGRPIDVLCANAGRGLGKGFVDQDWNDIRQVIDTNVTGTTYLLHKVAKAMKQRGARQDPDHRLDRRPDAGHVPGRLQRH